MRKVIKNGTVISMDAAREKFGRVDIVIDDDKISEIVDNYTGDADLIIDAARKISNARAYKLPYASSG